MPVDFAAAAAGVAEQPAGPRALAGGSLESADRARDGESVLADVFRHRPREDGEDFGSQGEWPVHPELLDWLAVEFMDSGWNVKALQKTIVMSATYRQSSKVTPELLQKDPENRLLARGPRLRFGPEMIRDQALALAGLLVEKLGGPSVKPYQPPGLWQELGGGKGYEQDKGEGLYRRSLYTYWKRTVAPPFMVNFDSPNREVCTVLREPHEYAAAGAESDERRHLRGGVAQAGGADDAGGRRQRQATGSTICIGWFWRVRRKRREQRVMLEALRGFRSELSSGPEGGGGVFAARRRAAGYGSRCRRNWRRMRASPV